MQGFVSQDDNDSPPPTLPLEMGWLRSTSYKVNDTGLTVAEVCSWAYVAFALVGPQSFVSSISKDGT